MRQTRRWLRTVETHRLTLGLFVAFVLTALTVLHLVPDKVSLEIGDVSDRDIRAAHAARYIDTVASENRRWQLLNTVSPEYETDAYAAQLAESNTNEVFTRLEFARVQMADLPLAERVRRVREQLATDLGIQLSAADVELVLRSEKAVFDPLHAGRAIWCLRHAPARGSARARRSGAGREKRSPKTPRRCP